MDRFRATLRWIKRLPVVVSYLLAAVLVALMALLRWGLDPYIAGYPYLLFFVAVALSALLLDRGTGFFASVLSAIVAVYFFIQPKYSFSMPRSEDVAALFVFLGAAFVIVMVGEAMRFLIGHLDDMEREKDALFRESRNRTQNNLQIISSILAIRSVRASHPEVRQNLGEVAERVGIIGRIQQHLYPPGAPENVGAADFLTNLCDDLALTFAGQRPVTIERETEDFSLPRSLAVSLGVIVSELVTNAVRYAFPDGRSGAVMVRLDREGAGKGQTLVLSVTDNGIGCGASIGGGAGTTLVSALARQMGGSAEWEDAGPGCRAIVRIPLKDR